MSSAIQRLTLYAPIIASSGIFAARRVGRGVDAMDDNPFFGTANFIIAGGQTLKGIGAAKDMAQMSAAHSAAAPIIEMSNVLKGTAKTSKFMQILGKVFKFSSENINPLICGASAIKVLGSDDMLDTAVRETLGLGLMFTCEKGAKKLLGMPIVKKNAQGVKETIAQTPLYKTNPFLKAQSQKLEKTLRTAMDDICKGKNLYSKIQHSSVPGVLKGLIFVCASIAGYKLGSMLANCILGKEEGNKTKAKSVKMNTNTNNTAKQNQTRYVMMTPSTTNQAHSAA